MNGRNTRWLAKAFLGVNSEIWDKSCEKFFEVWYLPIMIYDDIPKAESPAEGF